MPGRGARGLKNIKTRPDPFSALLVTVSIMWDKNVSPVGWYVASYVLRFVELDREDKDDLDGRFLTWENTIIVKANDLGEAYEKTVEIAEGHTEPYKGGSEGVDVQWVFEGVTEVLPIYEDLEDGAEIMWAERRSRKLRNIRKSVLRKSEILQ
jgi:hypothetical protein